MMDFELVNGKDAAKPLVCCSIRAYELQALFCAPCLWEREGGVYVQVLRICHPLLE